MKKNKLISVLLIGLLSSESFAWNAVAHSVIASIAYEHLNNHAKTSVDHLVSVFKQEYPAITDFTQMAPWPDELHAQKIESFSHWHYIDLPLSGDGAALKNLSDTDNALWAIKLITPVIKNPTANEYEKARFLAFLIHIVGDMHQPLHTTSRITANYPDGDHGGNLFTIIDPVSNTKISLHKYWDGGLGMFNQASFGKHAQPDGVSHLSTAITAAYPPEQFGAMVTDLDPEHWVNEGFALSSNVVYATYEKQVPNSTYIESGQRLSEQQVALAGYRLANLLNLLLG